MNRNTYPYHPPYVAVYAASGDKEGLVEEVEAVATTIIKNTSTTETKITASGRVFTRSRRIQEENIILRLSVIFPMPVPHWLVFKPYILLRCIPPSSW